MRRLNLKQRGKGGHPSPLPRILLLSLFFLCGVFSGQVLAGRIPDVAGQELAEYLKSYVTLETHTSPQTVLSAVLLYFRYPVLAALLGVASIGVVLLPGVTAAFGFFLSFSVSCFTAAFGPDGILLALAVMGLRTFVTLPCFFLLAVHSLGSSAMLASLSFGRGRRSAPVAYGPKWWTRFVVCLLVLLAGVCVELLCTPLFLRMTLERMFL